MDPDRNCLLWWLPLLRLHLPSMMTRLESMHFALFTLLVDLSIFLGSRSTKLRLDLLIYIYVTEVHAIQVEVRTTVFLDLCMCVVGEPCTCTESKTHCGSRGALATVRRPKVNCLATCISLS